MLKMPRDDDRLKRLEQFLGRSLQREPSKGAANKSPGKPLRSVPTPDTSAKFSSVGTRRVSLEEAVPGGYAVRVAERGSAYKVITPVTATSWTERFAAAFVSPASPIQRYLLKSCRMTAGLDDLLFVDLETTGLAQAPLFLIGTMSWAQGGLLIRQLLARDGGEEAAVIQLLLELAEEKPLLITFNGKSFDLPTLYQRAAAHGLPCVLHVRHCDLLHACRRAWRDQLPNCQLQTLEQHICGHPPRDETDIPGAQIPAAYQAFLRNGNAQPLAHIMRHNAQDLLTMAELIAMLPEEEG